MTTTQTSLISKHQNRLILFLLTGVGLLLRMLDAYYYKLGTDDYGHISLSSGPSVWAVVVNSYIDPHPPLRNIILYFLKEISANPLFIRMIGIIPGTLLIPASYWLIMKFRKSSFSALFVASVIAFSDSFIFISASTRPYPLTWLLLIWYVASWLSLTRGFSARAVALFLANGLLLLFSDYGIIAIMISISLIGTIKIRRSRIHTAAQKATVIMACGIHGLFFALQYFFHITHHHFKPSNQHIKKYLTSDISQLIHTIPQIFDNNFFYSIYLKHFMLVLFTCSIFYCLRKRLWALLLLGLLPILAFAALAYYSYYPFVPGRWTLQLSLLNLIFIGFCLSIFLKDWRSCRAIAVVITMGSIVNILGSPLFTHQTSSFFDRTSKYSRGAYIGEQSDATLAPRPTHQTIPIPADD